VNLSMTWGRCQGCAKARNPAFSSILLLPSQWGWTTIPFIHYLMADGHGFSSASETLKTQVFVTITWCQGTSAFHQLPCSKVFDNHLS
jgi:hypothetical protein